MCNPFLGLAEIPPLMTGTYPSSANAVSNVPTQAASKHLSSPIAKLCPMQLLGPCKNVSIAKLPFFIPRCPLTSSLSSIWSFAPLAVRTIHHSGLNSLASGPHSLRLVFTAQGGKMTVVPLGMNWPQISVSLLAARIVRAMGGKSRKVSRQKALR